MIKKTKYSWIVTNITTHAKNRKYGIYVPKQYKGILLKCKNYKCSLWEYRSIHHSKTWNIDDIWIKIQQFLTYHWPLLPPWGSQLSFVHQLIQGLLHPKTIEEEIRKSNIKTIIQQGNYKPMKKRDNKKA